MLVISRMGYFRSGLDKSMQYRPACRSDDEKCLEVSRGGFFVHSSKVVRIRVCHYSGKTHPGFYQRNVILSLSTLEALVQAFCSSAK